MVTHPSTNRADVQYQDQHATLSHATKNKSIAHDSDAWLQDVETAAKNLESSNHPPYEEEYF